MFMLCPLIFYPVEYPADLWQRDVLFSIPGQIHPNRQSPLDGPCRLFRRIGSGNPGATPGQPRLALFPCRFQRYGHAGEKLSVAMPVVILAAFRAEPAHAAERIENFVLFMAGGEIFRIEHDISPFFCYFD
jgi:hypothetical protein